LLVIVEKKMLIKINFYHARLQSSYAKEVSVILQKLIQQEGLPLFSVSYCVLSVKAETLKVYLIFTKEEDQNILEVINKDYLSFIKRQLAKSKKFPRVPQISFFLDQKLKKISDLEKIAKNIK
jgi:ribosome-binding factor A